MAGAQTIHRLIYVPFKKKGEQIRYVPRQGLEMAGGEPISIIIVDEASMLDHLTNIDLRRYKVPILYVGDHGQLQPIGTDPGLMANPNFRLEQIHRQAWGNPIIRLAAAFREVIKRFGSPEKIHVSEGQELSWVRYQ